MVPRAVLMKSGLVSVNAATQVNTAHSKTTMNAASLMSYLSKMVHSIVKRPIHKNTTFKYCNINQRFNTVRGKNVNTARPKPVVNVVKGNNFNAVKASACWGNQQIDLHDQGVIDSVCSMHMTGNMSYLTDYEEIDGGYVAFGGNPKGAKITRKDLKSSHDDGSKPSSNDGKKVDEDPRKESECNDQDKEDNVNSTNNVNSVSSTVNVAGTNEVNVVGGKISIELPFNPNMLFMSAIAPSTHLLDNGFQRGKINKILFIKRNKGDILLVQVYVDDIIFGSTKKELCFAFEMLMHEKF
ncbi:hypothetical protein Tco_1380184 [Tanacetum coccineum]